MLQGRCALITGSTQGLGYAMAERLAAEGCNIVMNGFGEKDEIESRRGKLESAHGVRAIHHGADVAEPAQIADLVATAQRTFGGVDVLINNAVVRHFSPIEAFKPEDWDRALAVNLSAPFHLIKMTLPAMKTRNWGRIINLASNWGLTGTVGRGDYVASKHGLVGLTKAVALEALPYNITCNALAPGSILTPHAERQVRERMARDKLDWDVAAQEFLKTRQPSGRFVTGEKVGQLIVFLCSDAASEMTGNPIAMDGGWLSI